jgi:membrane fusion protein, multidrug efflux system
VADAQLNLDYSNVKAPFTGRISNHYVSVGNLVSGSRAGTSSTTLLTTIVSLDPIYLDFDMSEGEYIDFNKTKKPGSDHGTVAFRLTGETEYSRQGLLDFVDNVISEATGTIHVRATVKNPGSVIGSRTVRLHPLDDGDCAGCTFSAGFSYCA